MNLPPTPSVPTVRLDRLSALLEGLAPEVTVSPFGGPPASGAATPKGPAASAWPEAAAHPVDDDVDAQREAIGPVADMGEPLGVRDDDVELVAVNDEIGLALRGGVHGAVDELDLAGIDAPAAQLFEGRRVVAVRRQRQPRGRALEARRGRGLNDALIHEGGARGVVRVQRQQALQPQVAQVCKPLDQRKEALQWVQPCLCLGF